MKLIPSPSQIRKAVFAAIVVGILTTIAGSLSGCGSYPQVYVVNSSDREIVVEMPKASHNGKSTPIPAKTGMIGFTSVTLHEGITATFKDAKTGEVLATKTYDSNALSKRCLSDLFVIEYPPLAP